MADPLAQRSSPVDALHSLGNRISSVRNQYPVNVSVDFTKLRTNALRRYMAFHSLQEAPGSSKEQLAIVVARHFNEECKRADEETSIVSFVTYLQNSKKDNPDAAAAYRQNRKQQFGEKENYTRQPQIIHDGFDEPNINDDDDDEMEDANAGYDDGYDDGCSVHDEENGEDDEIYHTSSVRKRKSSDYDRTSSNHNSSSTTKKKKRKARVYCVCKGSSFGNMIACDNKKCLDRSNWYHMRCVGLDPSSDPPETWYCPGCQDQDPSEIPENQYRKPVASVTYGDMISHALTVLPDGKGTFKEICDFVEKQYESQLNWKLESDQRKSPVWKSSVRKILFSNIRFRKHPEDKGLFCLAA